ncbi:hypothetical protein FYZ48_01530 [Gimesia chilikensis]|uniref:hypothetical protein n=1 Tax=Gimesia chilikensis TaxID=2605989 RepID=UPI0011EEB622|nr:hypothetical protein [Gimesia chilikensis]KAA0143077.1 hypothetical protein FYZ48_01530 [Gimesia chilikensis]
MPVKLREFLLLSFWSISLVLPVQLAAQPPEAPGVVTLPPSPEYAEELQAADEEDEFEYIDPYAARVEYDPSLVYDHDPLPWKLGELFMDALASPAKPLAYFGEWLLCAEHYAPESPLEDHAIGLQPIPDRPNLLVETNEKFLDIGFLNQGIVIPTGAVWRPSFWVFGTYRTGIDYFNNRTGTNVTEWANRLDLFGQLNLSGTERILVGLRSLDKELTASRLFTSYEFREGQWLDGLNADIQTLFFEGDFGEIFPNLDPYDVHRYDIGFSIGRQPMSFQQGLLINEDMVDAVTVTRNTVNGGRILNMRITGVYVESDINRNNNVRDPDARLYGLFTETDTKFSTINADVATVYSSNQQFGSNTAFGISSIQRLHGYHNTYNTSFHVLASFPHEGATTASGQGELLFSQISLTPHHSNDLVYFNAFLAIDQFTSPARGTLAGGPLGQVGILYAASGLGQYGAALSNQATNAAGGSLGYQLFYDKTRQQLIFEIGGRKNTEGTNNGAIAGGIRYQKAIGQHWIMLLDSFVSKQESRGVGSGARVEFLAKF